MLSGFKQFVLRGNVVDLAVGVVIGAAFGTVVTALVKDLINPIIALVAGKPDFTGISFTIGSTVFPIGDFFTAVVSFLLVAAAVYFFVVTPINALIARSRKAAAPADPDHQEVPGMPERDSDRRPPLQPLRTARDGQGRVAVAEEAGLQNEDELSPAAFSERFARIQ